MIFELNIFIVGTIAFIQWMYLRQKRRDLIPNMSPSQISREIIWSTVFPALSLIGIVLAILMVPFSLSIYILIPFIMAFLFWKDPVHV